MPTYKYSAVSKDGKKVSGVIDGFNELDAVAKVAAETGYIQPSDVERLLKFRDNPSDESWIGGDA